jgi:hypothetical protein
MAKRFLDTSFYKSPFVRGLQGAYKGLYLFIICDCEGSGIWAADFEAASLYIGFKIDKNGFEKGFVENGKAIDLKNGKYFIPDFIEHQYPGGLSNNNIAHKNFIIELNKYQLLDENLKPLNSPFVGSKVMVKVEDKVKEQDRGVGKGKGKTVFVPPTLEEVEVFFESKGHSKTYAKKVFEHYELGNWHDTYGNPVKAWKQKMNTNWVGKAEPTNMNHVKPTNGTPAPNRVEYTRADMGGRKFFATMAEWRNMDGCFPVGVIEKVREFYTPN